jgi:antitoxin component of RelBE/YafQ-DinJ toxin-antitoxin module
MGKHRDKTFQFRIDDETLANDQEIAQQRGLSLSAVFRAFGKLFARDPDTALENLNVEEEQTKADYDHEHARRRRSQRRY